VAAWQKLWTRGVITMEGNLPLAKAVSGAMYYILSSIQLEYDPSDPFIGLSPSDLAHGVTEDVRDSVVIVSFSIAKVVLHVL
jgi:hypothetical protein